MSEVQGDSGVFYTKEKLLTRRGVLWLGQTCNIRCHFCYFLDRINDKHHPEHAFMDLAKAKAICHDLRFKYGNTSIDIQGGEPLIWHHIYDLVAYCREIGLHPTLITNGIPLYKRQVPERLKAAGIRDLLISVHALGPIYDEIVAMPGGSDKQKIGIDNCREIGVPFRFNAVLSLKAIPQYEALARLAVEKGARAVNFLAFNPFEDQAKEGKRSIENVPRYSEVSVALNNALDILDEAGVEANVRYFPICMVAPRHRKSIYNFQQLPYDAHEWDYDSWTWTGNQPQRMKWGDPSAHHDSLAAVTYVPDYALDPVDSGSGSLLSDNWVGSLLSRIRVKWGTANSVKDELGRNPTLYRDHGRVRAKHHCSYQYSSQCRSCDAKPICDGFHGDYADMFGVDEAKPISLGGAVTDPTRFIREQVKIYEPEEADRPWSHKTKPLPDAAARQLAREPAE
jgi:sulfatase maturation enzyme AslB (radical SAM superfamily)